MHHGVVLILKRDDRSVEDCCTGREAWSKVSVAFKVALSSCEAEVVSVCQTAQECLGLRHLVEFLENFADMHELERFRQDDITAVKFDQIGSSEGRECYPVLIYSDSQSCLAALQNQGLSRRVRHMSHVIGNMFHSILSREWTLGVGLDSRQTVCI